MTNDHKLWGGRFSQSPDKQMQALNDSIDFDQAMYQADITGSIAYAGALVEAGLVSQGEASQIQDGLRTILDEFETGHFKIIEGDEDIHTAVERRLTELIGSIAGKLHTGRSRNDQVATDIRLWLRDAIDAVDAQVKAVQEALVAQAEPHIHTLMPGYTHLQPAQPITAAHWLMSFFWMMDRDRQRLTACRQRINISPLGSSALAGSPYPVNREKLAEALGFDDVTQNSLDGVSDRDGIAEFLFIASLINLHLSRLAEDIVIYSNPAFGFVKLPDAFSTGSSIMPQKRNADPMELTRGKAGRLVGNLTGLLTTLKGLPTGYNKDLQEDKEPLFDSFETLMKLLPVIAGMVRALTLVPEKMRAALDDGSLATELADWLVIEKKIPFREAHHLVGQAVKLSEELGLTLWEIPIEDYQKISTLYEAGLYAVLDFEAAVTKRSATGGTGPSSVQKQINRAKARLGQAFDFDIIRIDESNQYLVRDIWIKEWGGPTMVSKGRIVDGTGLPGFVAMRSGQVVGVVTFAIEGDACEIMSIDSFSEHMGIGTQLLNAVQDQATQAGCKRLWLITTNDNLNAIGFYQKRGFSLVAVYPNALQESRRLKSSIPEIGDNGIPLRDELEFEIRL